MSSHSEARGHLEVTKANDEDQANHLLARGWELFSVVPGGGEHVHYILTRRAA